MDRRGLVNMSVGVDTEIAGRNAAMHHSLHMSLVEPGNPGLDMLPNPPSLLSSSSTATAILYI